MSTLHEKDTQSRVPHAVAFLASVALTVVFGTGLLAAAASPGSFSGRDGTPQGIITVEVLGR
jgi:hypothetical protein